MIIEEFETAGYKVVHKLLNAEEYGVPQRRQRVVIVGFRDEDDYYRFNYPMPINNRKTLGDVVDL